MAGERDDKDHQSDSDSDSERDELQMERGSTEKPSIEQIMESKEVPPWTRQITFRAMAVSVLLSIVLSFIVMKLNVTTGVIPSLNIAAALLGFLFIKIWIKLTGKVGLKNAPFTRQENTVIQTCVVASSGIAFSSGLASYILGMTGIIAKQADTGNTHINIKEITLPWLMGFITVVSFVGLFSIVPLRKIMILEYKLSYPSGTATAYLINSFHTPTGAKLAKKQVRSLFKWFCASFTWAFFQWFYTASDDCGFAAFPTFGLQAYKYKFFFDFSSTYVGVGMICPYLINLSMLFGSVLSWGVMWPLIEKRKGDWYPADVPGSSFKGIQGYRVFSSIAMILGDGLYHFLVVLGKTFYALCKASKDKHSKKDDTPNYDDERRTQFFLKDQIPLWFALLGYVLFAALSIGVVPTIFHQLKWYHILIIYLFAPILAFCNSYGCGLTDWSLASSYGKLAIFIFGVWIGIDNGGLVAGLAACGVMMSIVSTASDLMQDFKTGYLTLASPRSMFVSQIIGTLIGCIVSPLVFWFFFYKAYPNLGQPDSAYPAPYGLMYRGIAIIGTEGTSALPKNCLVLCIVFFLAAALLNLIRDVLNYYKYRAANYVPSAMAMAVPFYLGGYFVIDMCVGSLIKFVMEKSNKKSAEAFIPAMASGLICGDSLWGMPAALLSLANFQPPICMKFLSRSSNAKVDALLS